jgi:hypothetical protein
MGIQRRLRQFRHGAALTCSLAPELCQAIWLDAPGSEPALFAPANKALLWRDPFAPADPRQGVPSHRECKKKRRQKGSICSFRFQIIGCFRSRTPGPPPFSSMTFVARL